MRTRHTQAETAVSEDSYFISLSDLMVGLLFIFIIILMAFAIAYRSAENELTNTDELKEQLLLDIEKALKERGVEVSVDLENGVLHLPESILFRSGLAKLNKAGRENIGILADTLYQLLPCYAEYAPDKEQEQCASMKQAKGRLDTIFIEGHTDDQPMGAHSPYRDNWDLSMARAIYTYKTLVAYQAELDEIKNKKEQPILSVSAYEARRPRRATQHLELEERRAKSRRIDLRFLMVAPKSRDAKLMEKVFEETEILLDGNSQ